MAILKVSRFSPECVTMIGLMGCKKLFPFWNFCDVKPTVFLQVLRCWVRSTVKRSPSSDLNYASLAVSCFQFSIMRN